MFMDKQNKLKPRPYFLIQQKVFTILLNLFSLNLRGRSKFESVKIC